MEYLVTERYFANGRTTATWEVYTGQHFVENENTDRCDTCRCVVKTLKEAQRAVEACKNA